MGEFGIGKVTCSGLAGLNGLPDGEWLHRLSKHRKMSVTISAVSRGEIHLQTRKSALFITPVFVYLPCSRWLLEDLALHLFINIAYVLEVGNL